MANLNSLRTGVELFKLRAGKNRQSLSFISLPVESKIEDSSKTYLSDDLSDPDFRSKTRSCNPENTQNKIFGEQDKS